MANAQAEQALKAKVDLVGNPTRASQLHQVHMDTMCTCTRFGARCAEWRTVLAVITANPLLALKPAVEDLTVLPELVAALALDERWAAADHAGGKPALEAMLEAMSIRQPDRERQIDIAVRAMRLADAASKANRITAYYAAAAAFLYTS